MVDVSVVSQVGKEVKRAGCTWSAQLLLVDHNHHRFHHEDYRQNRG